MPRAIRSRRSRRIFRLSAKHVIYLHMAGAPSQPELFDYKPKLIELNGQLCPESLYKKERFAFIKGVPKMLGTPYKFKKHGKRRRRALRTAAESGESGRRHHGRSIDGHRSIQSCAGAIFLNTGSAMIGRPSMGSWLTYGLGTENQNLPGFVVLLSGPNGPDGGTSLWGSGFLPSVYQGVQFRSQGDPVLYVSNPPGMDAERRRRSLDALGDLNRMQLADDRRSGNAHAHSPIRTGLSDAKLACPS